MVQMHLRLFHLLRMGALLALSVALLSGCQPLQSAFSVVSALDEMVGDGAPPPMDQAH